MTKYFTRQKRQSIIEHLIVCYTQIGLFDSKDKETERKYRLELAQKSNWHLYCEAKDNGWEAHM